MALVDFPDTPTLNQVFSIWRWDGGRWIRNARVIKPRSDGCGLLVAFPIDPGPTLCARGGVATGDESYVEPDGSTYLIDDFPHLAAFLGNIGGSGIFRVPTLKDTGRYLRSRNDSGSVPIASAGSNQSVSHTHVINNPQHNHGLYDPGHYHDVHHSWSQNNSGGPYMNQWGQGFPYTAWTNIAYTGVSFSAAATGVAIYADGGDEMRPETAVVFFALKT